MKQLLKRILTRETILYLIFGVLTTLVGAFVFDRCNAAWGERYAVASQTVSFVVAVLFAFFTNKPFVFQSKDWSSRTLAREMPTFFGGRILSFLIETVLVVLARDVIHAGQYEFFGVNGLTIVKLFPISVIVVVLNYVISKLLVFRNKK